MKVLAFTLALMAIVYANAQSDLSDDTTYTPVVKKCLDAGNKAYAGSGTIIDGAYDVDVEEEDAKGVTISYKLTLQDSVSGSQYFVPLVIFCPTNGTVVIEHHGKPCC